MAHGIEAIGDLVVQAETGDFSIENGKSRLRGCHSSSNGC